MSQDPTADPTRPETDVRPEDDVRPEQHGPEMDDTQVQATGELRDRFDPVTDEDAPE
jgi:hypothetical protein